MANQDVKRSHIVLSAAALIAAVIAALAYVIYEEERKSTSEDPLVWEDDIRALEEETSGPPGSFIFIGSSSIRFWSSLAQDMEPMSVVRRGFGGAKIGDAVYYAQRLVDLEKPAAIVIFVGTNDITPQNSKPPEAILESYRSLVERIRERHLNAPIYYIAITPTPSRWTVWATAQEANRLIADYSSSEPTLHFIDTDEAFLVDGKPVEDFFLFDGLHLNSAGYRAWTSIIRPRLLAEIQPGNGG